MKEVAVKVLKVCQDHLKEVDNNNIEIVIKGRCRVCKKISAKRCALKNPNIIKKTDKVGYEDNKINYKDEHWPRRLQYKNGGYYYVYYNSEQKVVWLNLGREKQKAIDKAIELNELKRKERVKALGAFRNATKDILKRVMIRDSYKCAYCGAVDDLGVDHVIPFIAGGSSREFNLSACCSACNASKRDKNPVKFLMEQMGFFDKLLDEILNDFRRKDTFKEN